MKKNIYVVMLMAALIGCVACESDVYPYEGTTTLEQEEESEQIVKMLCEMRGKTDEEIYMYLRNNRYVMLDSTVSYVRAHCDTVYYPYLSIKTDEYDGTSISRIIGGNYGGCYLRRIYYTNGRSVATVEQYEAPGYEPFVFRVTVGFDDFKEMQNVQGVARYFLKHLHSKLRNDRLMWENALTLCSDIYPLPSYTGSSVILPTLQTDLSPFEKRVYSKLEKRMKEEGILLYHEHLYTWDCPDYLLTYVYCNRQYEDIEWSSFGCGVLCSLYRNAVEWRNNE